MPEGIEVMLFTGETFLNGTWQLIHDEVPM